MEADDSKWCHVMADWEQAAEPKFWALHLAAEKRSDEPGVRVPPLPRDGHSVGGICWLKEESGSMDELCPAAKDRPPAGGRSPAAPGKN